MNDRELLESASKAANIPIVWPSCGPSMACRKLDGMDLWNPLEDDGDALRLAVKLGIHLTNSDTDAWASTFEFTCVEPFVGEPCAATRRAIVRAAAAIDSAAGKA